MKRIFSIGWMLISLLMSVSFASCSSDDDDDDPVKKEQTDKNDNSSKDNGDNLSDNNSGDDSGNSSTDHKSDVKPDAVDLGLPSGTLWATFNVGATAPEEYGNYFAWGEIEPKSNYNWRTYKWVQEGRTTWLYITKYTVADNQKYGIWYNDDTFVGDNKTELDAADDAAIAHFGSNWRMPTIGEWEELKDDKNCTWTWTTENGVYGYKVTSNKEGYTNNSIFLPACGYHEDDFENDGWYGYYWSRSLDPDNSYFAQRLYFYSNDSNYVEISSLYRHDGLSVRAVYSAAD